MTNDPEFFTARADADAKLAESSDLANVRERALRSEQAWRSMATRAAKAATERELREAQTQLAREQRELAKSRSDDENRAEWVADQSQGNDAIEAHGDALHAAAAEPTVSPQG